MIALDLVGGVVNEAATMTRGAPYIQTLSCLITYIVSISDVRTRNFGLLNEVLTCFVCVGYRFAEA